MQNQTKVHIKGVGQANVLAIAKYADMMGLTRQECVNLILNAPSTFATSLTNDSASKLTRALCDVGLPCTVIDDALEDTLEDTLDENNDSVTTLSTTSKSVTSEDAKYELAAYIHDFTHLTEFAAQIAAFTGQSGEDVISSLCKSPAPIIGNLSQTVASELAKRFAVEGITMMTSCPHKATFSIIAYAIDDLPSVHQYYKQLGMERVAADSGAHQWQAQDISYKQAMLAWQKANEFHLPIALLNHDYMRFDVQLDALMTHSDKEAISWVLETLCQIPVHIHDRMFEQLPIVIAKCLDFEAAEAILVACKQRKAKASAILVNSLRFDIEFHAWTSEKTDFMKSLLKMIMGREVSLPKGNASKQLLNLNANMHQGKWIQHESNRVGLKCQLIRKYP